MAAVFQKQLDDLMECSICKDVYREPRSLPFCQHSFCLVCCEGFCHDKHPGDRVECPLCREEFTIPPNGVRGLRKNFVLEKLKQLSQPPTDPHANADLTGMKTTLPSFCDKHTQKTLDWYCFVCEKAICASCLTQNHKSHEHRNLDEVTNELQVMLNAGVTDLQKVYDKCKLSLNKIEEEEGEFMRHMDRLETEITEDARRMQEMIEQSKSALLAEVSAKKCDRQKEVDNAKEEVRQQMAFVCSLMNYTTELLKNGTACDVAREASSLEKRKKKLLQSNEYKTSINELGTFTLAYKSREAELTELGNGLVGSIKPMKVKAIRSMLHGKNVNGLTILNKELYVLNFDEDPPDIAVYDTDTYSERRRLKVPGLDALCDLTSCQRYQCIYIFEFKKNVIHKVRVTTTGSRDQHTKWAVDDEAAGLSVNSDCNLVVTCGDAGKIKVFTTDGKLVKVIQLQQQADFFCPVHTTQLTADKYVVSHCSKYDEESTLYVVSIIDDKGEVQQSFSEGEGSDDNELFWALLLFNKVTVVNEMIFFVDMFNQRVVMLSPTLRYVRTVLSIPRDHNT